MGSIELKWGLRWVSHPHGPVYKTGAFLCRPRRQGGASRWPARNGSVQSRRLHKLLKWCGMPVLPRRALFGRQTCLLLHQCRNSWGSRNWVTQTLLSVPKGADKSVRITPFCEPQQDGVPARSLTSNLCLRKAVCILLTPRERWKWPLELVSRQPVRVFSPLLICLSHPAIGKWLRLQPHLIRLEPKPL